MLMHAGKKQSLQNDAYRITTTTRIEREKNKQTNENANKTNICIDIYIEYIFHKNDNIWKDI